MTPVTDVETARHLLQRLEEAMGDFIWTTFGDAAQVCHAPCGKVAHFVGDTDERRHWMVGSHLCGSLLTKWNETDLPSPGPAIARLCVSVAQELLRQPYGIGTLPDVTSALIVLQEAIVSLQGAAEIEAGSPAAPLSVDLGEAAKWHSRRLNGALQIGEPVYIMAAELFDGGGLPDSVGTQSPALAVVWPGFELCARHVMSTLILGELQEVLSRTAFGRVDHGEREVVCFRCQAEAAEAAGAFDPPPPPPPSVFEVPIGPPTPAGGQDLGRFIDSLPKSFGAID